MILGLRRFCSEIVRRKWLWYALVVLLRRISGVQVLPVHLLALTIAQKTSRHPACKWTQRLTGGKSSRRHSSALKHGQMASFRRSMRSMAQSPIDGACDDDDDDDHYYILLLSLLLFWVWLFIISIIMIMGSHVGSKMPCCINSFVASQP